MCGRYTHLFTWRQLHRLMGLVTPSEGQATVEREQLPLRYNVAPSQSAPVAVGGRDGWSVQMLGWGLVPSWAKDPEGSDLRRPINARSETVASSPMFRGPMRTRRCVVPASGFYEWQARGEKAAKQPWYITPADGEVFAMAGVWDEWRERTSKGEGAAPIRTFAILTTSANEAMRPLHHRMPVMLTREGVAAWMDAAVEDAAALADLLRPCDDDALRLRKVGTWVNSPAHDDARCLEESAVSDRPARPAKKRTEAPEEPGLFGTE